MMLRSQNTNAPPIIKTETITQTDINKYEVISMTNSNKAYEVTILDSDIAACSCPDFEFRKRTCKHIIEVLIRVVGSL